MGAGLLDGLFIGLALFLILLQVLLDDLFVLLVDFAHEGLLELLLFLFASLLNEGVIFEFLQFLFLLFFKGLLFFLFCELVFLVKPDCLIVFAVEGEDYYGAEEAYQDSDHIGFVNY